MDSSGTESDGAKGKDRRCANDDDDDDGAASVGSTTTSPGDVRRTPARAFNAGDVGGSASDRDRDGDVPSSECTTSDTDASSSGTFQADSIHGGVSSTQKLFA